MYSRIGSFLIIVAIVTVSITAAPAHAADKPPAKPTVAVFTFAGQITESPEADDLLLATRTESFQDLVSRLKKAESDPSVRSVVLLVSNLSLGVAQIEELRQVFDAIKASGKEVLAHADSLSMSSYLLLSGASRIVVVPTGDIWIHGLYGESPYLRGLFDLIGVTPDFTTCGDYKSASEMFMRKEPSPQARENLEWLIDGIYGTYLRLIASGRGVDVATVQGWIDHGVYSAEGAQAAGVIDDVQFRQDFVAELKSQLGDELVFDRQYAKKKAQEIDLSSPFGILKFYGDLLAGPKKKATDQPSLVVVHVEGPILAGSREPSGFPLSVGGVAYSTPIARALDRTMEDDTIRGVVLRVDSPGGSAVASEIILNAAKRVAAKKPLVVSMGNVAGSGGYYVACGANTIFADESTITGSIGVVSGKLATNSMWRRIGVHWSPVQRGANAGMLASGEVFSDSQRALLQNWMEEVYGAFKNHVLAIRGDRLKKDIEQLAGGRVYTGKQALELGLVDRIGGLQDALEFVAKEAGVEQYEVRVLPEPKGFLEILLGDLRDGEKDTQHLSFPSSWPPAQRNSLFEAALPHLQGLEPNRLRGVLTAWRQLQILQQETVSLAMPVIEIRD